MPSHNGLTAMRMTIRTASHPPAPVRAGRLPVDGGFVSGAAVSGGGMSVQGKSGQWAYCNLKLSIQLNRIDCFKYSVSKWQHTAGNREGRRVFLHTLRKRSGGWITGLKGAVLNRKRFQKTPILLKTGSRLFCLWETECSERPFSRKYGDRQKRRGQTVKVRAMRGSNQ